MALLIDRIYQKVKTFVNTEVNGNVSPEEFNLVLHDAIQSRVDEYFFDLNRAVNRENRGLVSNFLENVPDKIREKVDHYLVDEKPLTLVSLQTDKYKLPDDYKFIDEILIGGSTSFEMCRSSKDFNILKSVATSQYPIVMLSSGVLKVYPETAEDVTITYIRTIKYPKWTYTVVSGVELFNPSANDFEDADIHPSEENEVVRRVLMGFGVNLKDTDIQNFTMNQENTEFNQDNTI